MKTHLALSIAAWFLATLVPCIAQESEPRTIAEADGLPLVQGVDIKTYFVTPKYVDAGSMFEAAKRLFGRQVYVEEHGGYFADPVHNLQRMGDSVIIYDVEPNATRIGSALHGMDLQAKEAQTGPRFQTIEWSPRSITMDTALAALAPFQGRETKVSRLKEANTLILQARSEQLVEMTHLLEKLDQPETQYLVTCQVIGARRAGGGDEQGALDPELVEGLARLVPYGSFHLLTVGIVRAAAGSQEIELRMDEDYMFQMRPEAHDDETGTITAHCEFQGVGQQFQTRTTIRNGEWTVLGATGRDPLFAVIRLEAIE